MTIKNQKPHCLIMYICICMLYLQTNVHIIYIYRYIFNIVMNDLPYKIDFIFSIRRFELFTASSKYHWLDSKRVFCYDFLTIAEFEK